MFTFGHDADALIVRLEGLVLHLNIAIVLGRLALFPRFSMLPSVFATKLLTRPITDSLLHSFGNFSKIKKFDFSLQYCTVWLFIIC